MHQTVQVDACAPFGQTLLHLALRGENKKFQIAELLLRRGANPNLTDFFRNTPLHLLCEKGGNEVESVNFLERFLKINDQKRQMVQLDVPNLHGQTPLHLALACPQWKVAEVLLRNGSDPNLISPAGSTALNVICKKGDKDEELANYLKTFFEIADAYRRTVDVDVIDPNNKNRTPLQLAIERGQRKVFELLLRRGANPNLATKYGNTPLHYICQRDNDDDLIEIFFKICDEKHRLVPVDARNEWGQTPLIDAPFHGLTKVTELLLKRGANPCVTDNYGCSPLHWICESYVADDDKSSILVKKFFEIVDLYGRTISFDDQNEYGLTPLHLAHRTVRVDVSNDYYETPLHCAVAGGLKKVTEMLLRKDVDPNVAGCKNTPLHVICNKKENDYDLAKMLFEVSDEVHLTVQVDAKDEEGNTPLHLALRNGHWNLIELLLEKGATVNSANAKGSTALHVVCEKDSDDESATSLKIFFDISEAHHRYLRIDAWDNEGRRPLHLALARRLNKTAEILLRRGADPSLTDNEKSTALHVICSRKYDDDDFLELFWKINDENRQPVEVDALEKYDGRTPLHLALERGHINIAAEPRRESEFRRQQGTHVLRSRASSRGDISGQALSLLCSPGIRQNVLSLDCQSDFSLSSRRILRGHGDDYARDRGRVHRETTNRFFFPPTRRKAILCKSLLRVSQNEASKSLLEMHAHDN
ncbi:unnamed protein product [Trichogramma brassicae]|uniref:Uncharacterized protein n=1 Tax=Trichogramma brassicae TaxID=86971 RepID=A0A6H5ISE9_9HYME|nr:unnamed protein product [Trichogramma brassicae]